MSETKRREPMFALVFYCRETGEFSRRGPYETYQEALDHRKNPGYGIEKIVQLNTDKTIAQMIVDNITDFVWGELVEVNLNPDDESLFYPVFYDHIWEYHDQMQPGYETIPEYMRDKPVPTRSACDVFGY